MPSQKKTNFSEGDTVDVKLDGINSASLGITTGSANADTAEFEIYLSPGDAAPWYGPVDLVDPKDRATPLASLVGKTKSGTVDCSGYSAVRIKRKADGAGTNTQAAYWSVNTF